MTFFANGARLLVALVGMAVACDMPQANLAAPVQEPDTPPAIVLRTIAGVPGARLLDPARDLDGAHTAAALREAGYYEQTLYAVGEPIAVATTEGRNAPVTLKNAASGLAAPLTTLAGCTEAVVTRVAGNAAGRWYEAEVPSTGQRGWILARDRRQRMPGLVLNAAGSAGPAGVRYGTHPFY